MTRIKFFSEDNGWRGFEAKGHTNASVHGEDIVCAAVSALTQTAVLGLTEVLKIDCHVEIAEKPGVLVCLLPQELNRDLWEQAQLVLKVLFIGLQAIGREIEYRKYVSVREVPYREN